MTFKINDSTTINRAFERWNNRIEYLVNVYEEGNHLSEKAGAAAQRQVLLTYAFSVSLAARIIRVPDPSVSKVGGIVTDEDSMLIPCKMHKNERILTKKHLDKRLNNKSWH